MSPGPPGESARLTLMLWRDGIRLGLGADGGYCEIYGQSGRAGISDTQNSLGN